MAKNTADVLSKLNQVMTGKDAELKKRKPFDERDLITQNHDDGDIRSEDVV